QMYVMGGAFNLISNEVDIYDPLSDTWSLGDPFVTARRNAAIDSDGTNNIWVAGGYDANLAIIASTEVFNCPVSPCASAKGTRPQAIPDAAGQATLNLKLQILQAMIPQQRQQIDTLTAQVKEQAAQIQKVNAQLEIMSKPEAKMVGESLQTAKTTKEN